MTTLSPMVTGFRCSVLAFPPCPLHSASSHVANLVIVVTVQVFRTSVCSLQTSSNVDSLGKGETLLSEKVLLRELAVQPANESVSKSVIQEVPKFAEGSYLAELRYILRYRLQRFLIPMMKIKSLFAWSPVTLACSASSMWRKILERLLLSLCGAKRSLRRAYVVALTTLRKPATCFSSEISLAWKKRSTRSSYAEMDSWLAWYLCSYPKHNITDPTSLPVAMS